MKVCKFGGSSLASADQIIKVCDIMLEDQSRRVMVVSAPGKRNHSDIKVTDLLIYLAQEILAGNDYRKEFDAVIGRYSSIATELNLDGSVMQIIENDLKSRISVDITNKERFMDLLKASGEDNCAKLVADYFKSIGIKAKYFDPRDSGMLLSDEFGHAQILPESYEKLAMMKDYDGIIVYPGFFGCTRSGDIVTFPRGGSDITGAILAAALDVEEYENWTDVDAVYAVNPALVKNPYAMKEITYNEMRELAYAGFSVLHEEALAPAFQKSIPVHIRNTNNPTAKGTMIVKKRRNFEGMVTGIAGAKGFATINLSKYLMNREIGFVLKVLQILADEKIPFEHMPSGIDSISIVVKQSNLNAEKEENMIKRFREELQIETMSINRNLSIVMIVGEAMAHTVGVTARAATCLSKAGINLEIIDQGASEISVIFGVREEYCNYAMKELYKEFFVK
ncbi:MAG: aspartate kinase [Saccharofermentanales bacterium]